ncbi:class C beta-lactamase-related serine hydrolase [Stenotrophomonas maltophilia]|uniref:serine hydrolase domain-containing protein n=1 Tax=Stenotrophomonas maltophilia TaxID=40324 RepID=UPI000DB652FA|nr:serine hydrolase [Stenotrophomonas maltophilia]MBA0428453.1 class C beta-lactamase-related serine hydrolase [Stenotrophomonas maltophilia]PZP83665.1 MAG: serine hydrolase [Stenotrophomonas maltophilia]
MRSILSVLTLLCAVCTLPFAARATPPDPARLQALQQAIASDELKQIRSVLLQVDGKVVYEGYFNGADAQTLHDVRSASKGVTALLVGTAIGDGTLPGVQARVYDYFPTFTARHAVDPRLRATTVQDLLTMSSLWECDDENPFSAGHEERMYVTEKWLDFALSLPVKGFAPWMQRPQDSPHGRAFAYCTANPFVLGAVLEHASGQPLADYAARMLERPLGIIHSQWNRSPEGIGMGGGGTRYRTRDLARFGQLVLDDGRWQGRQLVPKDYIEAMVRAQATTSDGSDYGYQWWGLKLGVQGSPRTVWAMSGNGGNYVFVVPEQRVVAVVTSQAFNRSFAHPQSRRILTEFLLPALH